MHLPRLPADEDDQSTTQRETRSEDLIQAAETRNLLAIAGYQIVMRIGWIFKTESIVIPAFLDTIAGAGWMRGMLPVLNRVSQSAVPVLAAEGVRRTPLKKRAMGAFTAGMALCFVLLAGIWFAYGTEDPAWLPTAFLSLYTIFFAFTGAAHLSSNTLQGKLIRANRRGRLMSLSASVGSVFAILFALLLLGQWLAVPRADGQPGGGFAYIFAFSGGAFALASLLVLLVREPVDAADDVRVRFRQQLQAAASIVRVDANFRRLVVVAMLFSTNMIVMPHYQALARVRLDMALGSLVTWVVVQNAAAGCYSLLAGFSADRRGNLRVLRYLLFGTASMPLVAIGLAALGPSVGGPLFWIVFALFGMLPITIRVMTNLTLEIAPQDDHPRYLSTLSLAMALPFVLSPLVGWLVDATSFEAVFIAAALAIAMAGLLTFRVDEPRSAPDGEPGSSWEAELGFVEKLDAASEDWPE